MIGPANRIYRASPFGIDISQPYDVFDNTIADSATSIMLGSGAGGSSVRGNVIVRNNTGIAFVSNSHNNVIVHNVIADNTGEGLSSANNVSGTVFQNNIVMGNANGLSARDSNFAFIEYNDFFSNGTDCTSCTPNNSLALDPLFLDAASDDYRLSSSSPCINAGTDTGFDRNGPDSGNFDGALPDVGAFEYLGL